MAESSAAERPCRYSIVVPVYNEAAGIAALCRELKSKLPGQYEVLICYDFPEDNTLPALAQVAEADRPPRLRLIHNQLGRGVRYAIEAGMRAAAAPIVVVTMADLSDDYSNIEPMVQLAEQGVAVVCGSRYMRGGSQTGGPLMKRTLSRLAGITLYWFAGIGSHDATNSFKAYRKDFLARTPIESTAGFCLGLELTAKARFSGSGVGEVPAVWRDRSCGESRFQLRKWLPYYLYWYFWALGQRLRGR
jgi:glycosyltransferase involved in cell wall biosynthesis